jgi:hypothetical protein
MNPQPSPLVILTREKRAGDSHQGEAGDDAPGFHVEEACPLRLLSLDLLSLNVPHWEYEQKREGRARRADPEEDGVGAHDVEAHVFLEVGW